MGVRWWAAGPLLWLTASDFRCAGAFDECEVPSVPSSLSLVQTALQLQRRRFMDEVPLSAEESRRAGVCTDTVPVLGSARGLPILGYIGCCLQRDLDSANVRPAFDDTPNPARQKSQENAMKQSSTHQLRMSHAQACAVNEQHEKVVCRYCPKSGDKRGTATTRDLQETRDPPSHDNHRQEAQGQERGGRGTAQTPQLKEHSQRLRETADPVARYLEAGGRHVMTAPSALGMLMDIDIYIHWGVTNVRRQDPNGRSNVTQEMNLELYRGLIDMQRAGKTRHIAVGLHTRKEIEYLINSTGVKPDIMWGWITPFMPQKQIDLAMWAKGQGMAVAAWGPFNWMRLDEPTQLEEHRSITDELARKYNASVYQMLAYLTIEGRQQGIP
ncbi:PDK [Symbiodinium necroappetens]|uniref:PDK protein n=1 Tax=Symbiodinium necroappetens TaxID=1628268 RepID=A0A812SEJ8_9DINO|nr:PDK [Symbiodinium necroappetens]